MGGFSGGNHAFEARVTDLIIRLTILGLLVYWSLNLIRPFLPIVIWAVILTVALFPVHAWLSRLLGGRHRLAAVAITLAAFVVIVGPVAALTASLVETVGWIASGVRDGTMRIPPPPAGIAHWPLIGERLQADWSLASTNLEELIRRYREVLLPAGETVFLKLSSVGADMLRFVLAVLLAGFLFVPGHRLAEGSRHFAGRIVAPRGALFIDLAGATIRNVSRGVVGVSLLQTLLAGIVLQAFGVPGAGLLAFAILVLCIIQIGPMLILLPVVVWAWMTMSTGSALLFTAVMIPIGLLDNFLKPLLMARGLATPALVIFLGVIGGTLVYGLIGLFLGPIVLAVFYDLLVAWARGNETADVAAQAPDGHLP